jgi:hypothetical protein
MREVRDLEEQVRTAHGQGKWGRGSFKPSEAVGPDSPPRAAQRCPLVPVPVPWNWLVAYSEPSLASTLRVLMPPSQS